MLNQLFLFSEKLRVVDDVPFSSRMIKVYMTHHGSHQHIKKFYDDWHVVNLTTSVIDPIFAAFSSKASVNEEMNALSGRLGTENMCVRILC